MTRKAKLEKALAPSLPNDTIRFADMAWGIQCHADRLAPLHAALIEAVEALEFYRDEENWSYSNSQTCPAMIQGEDIINREGNPNRFAGGLKAKEALAKLDQILKGDRNEKSYT